MMDREPSTVPLSTESPRSASYRLAALGKSGEWSFSNQAISVPKLCAQHLRPPVGSRKPRKEAGADFPAAPAAAAAPSALGSPTSSLSLSTLCQHSAQNQVKPRHLSAARGAA